MASSRFQLISEKLVKPSSPTPPSLRSYKLSSIDQLAADHYMRMAFFYPNQQHKHPDNTSQISSLLEESLSKTLSYYYPFAGRLLRDNISIDCNDMGATFLEVRIKCPMPEILTEVYNVKAEAIVFPSGLPLASRHDQASLVVAQLSHFDCGGIALNVSMSHKVGDGHTLCNFINDWAATARQSSKKPSPQFIGASILPPVEAPPIAPLLDSEQKQQCITKRYVFYPDKISQLKTKATTELGVPKPTRVEVVSALLHKCAMAASMLYSSGSFKTSVLNSMLNLRSPIQLPADPQNYVGNFASFFRVITTDESEMNFSRLVSKIRREKVLNYERYKAIKTNELLSAVLEIVELYLKELQGKNDIDEYYCSSFCKFPTYQIDFGWGRPLRVSVPASPIKNVFILMDNHNGDGVEAFITLEEQVMSAFQSDPELLAFASLS